MDAIEDQLGHIKTEWKVVKERWFTGESLDPVFEGMVKDFCVFDYTMQDMYKKTEAFMKSVDQLAEGLVTLSEAAIAGLTQVDDNLIRSDSCKMREATNQITRSDAPHSAIAKLRRDMDFNIMHPIRSHLLNNRNLKAHLEKRRRKLLEFNIAKKNHDDCVKRGLASTDRRMIQTQASLDAAKTAFHEVDKHIFEWLYILEEYKGDILDSTLQTLKYLQYEFFATSAHAISSVLPARMEFRPMVEMTPEHLEAQVEMELQDDEDDDADVVTDFSVRLIEKLAKDNKTKPGEGVDSCAGQEAPISVDPLSLSSLLSQGFEEGPARQALRKHRNDTQAALDYLINGGQDEEPQQEAVRMPTTVKRVQRLKARRRAQQEKMRRQEGKDDRKDDRRGEDREASSRSSAQQEDAGGTSSSAAAPTKEEPAAPAKPVAPPLAAQDLLGMDEQPQPRQAAAPAKTDDLLSLDEPPPPTDFSKAIDVMPLPAMQSFDASKCELQPLPASVAAGTAVTRSISDDGLLSAPAAPGDAMAAVQAMAAQASVTPEMLMLAAQQLQAQQQSQNQSTLAADHLASLYQASTPASGAPMPGSTGGGYPAAAPAPAAQQQQANGSTAANSGFASLDPLAMQR